MGLVIIILLAGLWASILLPGVLRTRRDISAVNSVHSFERTMNMLAHRCSTGTTPAAASPPGRHVLVLDDPASVAGYRSRTRMRRRQRAALAQLGSAASVTGGLAVLVGGLLWPLFCISATAFAGYALLVAQVRSREAERARKIRRIAHPAPHPARQHVRVQRRVG